MNNDTFAAFWRKQFSNELLDEKPYCMGYAWTYLWAMANWKDGYVHFRNETIFIKRGQRITSFIKLGKQFGWDRKKVKKFFNLLEKEQMLTYRTTNRYVRYTICGYDKYQKKQKDIPTERPTAYPTAGQQRTQQLPTNNKGNKVNKENNYPGDFKNFWNDYPRKEGKYKAMLAWTKLTDEEKSAAKSALPKHAASNQWKKDDGRFIPHASSWLNQRRFEDEIKIKKTYGG